MELVKFSGFEATNNFDLLVRNTVTIYLSDLRILGLKL